MNQPSNAFFLSVVLALWLAELSQADDPASTTRMDIFITSYQPIKRLDAFVANHPDISIRVHTLDAIENLENALSQGLPADPHQAKRMALARLKQLSQGTRARLQHSATSIATALHYGIEQYPAIVFDADFVVYGLTDPFRALQHYRRWRLAEAP